MEQPDIVLEPEELRRMLADGKSVDVQLPGGGRLYLDRPLPFVCLFLNPAPSEDHVSHRFVTSQASFAIASLDSPDHDALVEVLVVLSDSMAERFGGFLILEIRCRTREQESGDPYDFQPEFRIYASDGAPVQNAVRTLARALKRTTIQHFVTNVSVHCADAEAQSILPTANDEGRAFRIELEMEPVYRRPDGKGVYPLLFDRMRTQISDALRKAAFAFAQDATRFEAPGYLALGRRVLERAVMEVDEGLSDIDESFDFLLQMTPINADEAWSAFSECGCQKNPVFRYRPLPIDPALLKRRLYDLPVEQVEDPSLRWIFLEKQEELDRQITMLSDRDSRQFFFESLQLYGEVSGHLLDEARDLLDRLPVEDYDLDSTEHLDAEAFAELAASELTHYRRDCPDFPETLQIRHDMPAGLMVSRGRLLMGHQTKIPAARVEPLLHHEVGTHMLTYFNGRVHPMRLLYNGLAGYESLQEGLAVLAEYLVDGLNVPRIRVLAARVVAAHCMVDGSSFVDLYRLLRRAYGFEEHEAYSISLRTFRGGGLIKDVIYLRGLHELMHYMQDGGDFEALFVGKMALHHLPVLEELRERGILENVPLRPRYLSDAHVVERLDAVRRGGTFIDLIEHRPA